MQQVASRKALLVGFPKWGSPSNGNILWMDKLLHDLETMVETIVYWYLRGESSFQGFSGGARFCASTVWQQSPFGFPFSTKSTKLFHHFEKLPSPVSCKPLSNCARACTTPAAPSRGILKFPETNVSAHRNRGPVAQIIRKHGIET